MTNVPQRLRDLWSDIYILCDRNYLMPNTQEAWDSFWQQAMQIQSKYENEFLYLFKMFDVVSTIIESRIKKEEADKYNETHKKTLEDINLF